MNKKRIYDLIKKLATPTLILSTATIFFFQPWNKKISPPKKQSLYREVSEPIPPQEGILIKQPDETYSQNTYYITTHLPIYIRRYYPEKTTKNQPARVEYLVLKTLAPTIRDTNDMYRLIENVNIENKKNEGNPHMRYEPQVLESYQTPGNTRDTIEIQSLRMRYQKRYLTLGVFHRVGNKERLVGRITVDSVQKKGVPKGAYCSYYTGHPNDIKVKGITRLSLEATINHLIEVGHIPKKVEKNVKGKKKMFYNRIVLIIDKRNKRSKNIAEKLHFKRYEAVKRYPRSEWRYPCKIENAYFYEISVENWIKKNRRPKEVKKRQKQR
ncbi:MAG: GNAT family protein [Bacteroidota bacterium]